MFFLFYSGRKRRLGNPLEPNLFRLWLPGSQQKGGEKKKKRVVPNLGRNVRLHVKSPEAKWVLYTMSYTRPNAIPKHARSEPPLPQWVNNTHDRAVGREANDWERDRFVRWEIDRVWWWGIRLRALLLSFSRAPNQSARPKALHSGTTLPLVCVCVSAGNSTRFFYLLTNKNTNIISPAVRHLASLTGRVRKEKKKFLYWIPFTASAALSDCHCLAHISPLLRGRRELGTMFCSLAG